MKIFKGTLRAVSGTVLLLLAMENMKLSLDFSGNGLLSLAKFTCYLLMGIGLFINARPLATAGAAAGLAEKVMVSGGLNTVISVLTHFRPTVGNLALCAQLLTFILLICCFLAGRNMILPVVTAAVCVAGFLVFPEMSGALSPYMREGTLIADFFYHVAAVPLTFTTVAFALGS